jgi:hypothetical protein
MGEDIGHLLSDKTIILLLLDVGTVSALRWLQLVMMTPLNMRVTGLLLTVPAAASC